MRLVLRFLGLPQIYLDDNPIATDRRKAIALLAYLAVDDIEHPRQKYSRESLSALFWPDYEQAKAFSNLRRTIWEVNQALGEGWLIADRESVQLNEETDIDLDVAHFLNLISQGSQQRDTALRISLLSDAAKLYRNHLLTGFSLKDAPNFNEWAFTESESLRGQFAEALTMLSEAHCQLGQAQEAISYARRLIALDPLHESAHRQLMEIYLQAGQHSAALKQYQACEQLLRKELNLDPQPETRALYKKIRKGQGKPIETEQQRERDTPKHNLHFQLSTFIGRAKECNEVIKLLNNSRLVTLTGVGGIGKTRLSLQIGQQILDDYPDGIWFIPFDSLSNPTLVPQTVASAFDVHETTDRLLLEKLTNFLHEKTTLLILDNCEHLLETCAQLITTLLQNCPNLKILVTSRETLNILGEAIYYIPSLSIPEHEIQMEKYPEYESVRLFMDRAMLALSSFSLTKENISPVVEICRKVDGIPLAIELAAARVNILQVEEILKQLQQSFILLASENRNILPRQQTLQASMDWSWGLLTESEQIFLRQLSVFAGGWTLESAQAVCDGEVLTLTGVLVKKSLIVVDQKPGQETRYHFHEIVHQYLHEKFVGTAEEEEVRTRHLKYFLRFAAHAEIELRGSARMDWTERLNEERNNIRVALTWADNTNVEAGLYLSGRLRRYWGIFDVSEGIQWLVNFLHKAEAKDFLLARAIALYTYGWLLTWMQQFDKAFSATEESLSLARTVADQHVEADDLVSMGNIKQFLDEPDAAIKLFQQSLELAQSLHDSWREANAYWYLGWDRRDFKRSMGFWEKALSLYRKVGDQIAVANLLGVMGQFRVLNGEIELGEKYLDEALLLWKSYTRANSWENPKIGKSLIALTRGDYEQAYSLLEQALQTASESGNKMSYLWVRVRLGYAALRAGRLEEARGLFIETARGFQKDGFTIGVVFALEGMASLYVTVGKPEHAARLIGSADAMRKKIHDQRPLLEQADVDKIIAACLAKLGEVEFSDAYDAGQAMTLDEAVAYALEENR